MSILGEAKIPILADFSKLQSGLDKAQSMVRSSMEKAGASVASAMSKAGSIITGAFSSMFNFITRWSKWAILGLVGITAAMVKMAVDAGQTEQKFNAAFGSMAYAVREWSDTFAESVKISRYSLRDYLSNFSLMLKGFGIGADMAAEMSVKLTELAINMARVHGERPETMFEALRSGLIGRAMVLKQYGISVKDAMDDEDSLVKKIKVTGKDIQKAFGAMGMAAANPEALAGLLMAQPEIPTITKKPSEANLMMERYNAIIQQSARYSGAAQKSVFNADITFKDFWNTIKEIGISIGNVLLPAMMDIALTMSDWLKDKSNRDAILVWANKFADAIEFVWNWLKQVIAVFSDEGWKVGMKRLGEDFKTALSISFDWLAPRAVELGKLIGRGFWEFAKGAIFTKVEGFGHGPRDVVTAGGPASYWLGREYVGRLY